jgi:hypothetical protein
VEKADKEDRAREARVAARVREGARDAAREEDKARDL